MSAARPLPLPLVRSFVPLDVDAEFAGQLEPVFVSLLALPVGTEDELLAFLAAWNELSCLVAQSAYELHLWTAQHTDREDYRDRFLRHNREVKPRLAQWDDALDRRLLTSPALATLESRAGYARFLRQARARVELYREINVPLLAELEERKNDYGQVSGGWLVDFRGEQLTMAATQRYLADPDRDTREAIWRRRLETLAASADTLDDVWDRMFQLRNQVAHNAGFDNFRDYIFAEKLRDYGPEECFALHELIAEEVVPVVGEIAAETVDRLGLSSFRPWDGAADPDGRDALTPFDDVERLQLGTERMMARLDPELGEWTRALREHMDLGSRPAKRQGGFMMSLPAIRRPFIFANATGRHDDIVTLLHELGHAFHYLAAHDAAPMAETSTPMEFNEVASMAMELLHYEALDEFYGPDERQRAVREHLRRIPRVLCSVAMGDAFQHQLYTLPDHTRTDRRQLWNKLGQRYSPHVDTDGISGDVTGVEWQRILHFYLVPFYFIEYGFAQLGALQVAVAADRDPARALGAYKDALALGPTRPVAALYAAAGAEFIPTRKSVRELMNWVRQGLGL